MTRLSGSSGCRTVEPQRIVNVHQAKTHLSRLIDDAHAGETILLAKAGKPWARLMPLSNPDALLEPMATDELASWESGALLPEGLQP